ncbi:5-(carboxyamino)imidazole ribonucleotide synthase [Piscinibacter sakaiensis]|uniref:5-(carboxyamino)imidazole ribonucleotide synthase n=1 Tax=Piscinibacter sakaiensis TaxID=1547922 RepID=UPI003AAFC7D0
MSSAAHAATSYLPPGSTLGVMGGGQLGRMFVHAAQQLGYFTAVLDEDPASPAGLVSHYHIATPYLDEQGLAQLMQRSAAITTEFENVPAAALRTLGAQRPVAPAADAVAVCQDRAAEKNHFRQSGVPTAPFASIGNEAELAAIGDDLLPGILKTAQLGYDGKGQRSVATRAELAEAWQSLGRSRCLLEKRLALRCELSVIVARARNGEMVELPVQQNRHHDGILAVTIAPVVDVAPALAAQAVAAARELASSLNYVGVLCVEFFVVDDGSADGALVANEMAPRPHNSGHYSVDACDVSQFELQVRTLVGAPLTAPRQHSPAVMLNLLGDLWFAADDSERPPRWDALLALPGVHLHLYGKLAPRRGRKMGHLTVTAADSASALAVARQAAAVLGLPTP